MIIIRFLNQKPINLFLLFSSNSSFEWRFKNTLSSSGFNGKSIQSVIQ